MPLGKLKTKLEYEQMLAKRQAAINTLIAELYCENPHNRQFDGLNADRRRVLDAVREKRIGAKNKLTLRQKIQAIGDILHDRVK
jgi:hypothetical protein